MELRGPDDAAVRHLGEVADDIRGLLGPGVELTAVILEPVDADTVAMHARYELGGTAAESIGRGENAIEAHAALRCAIVVDRIGLGLRLLT